MIPDFTDRVLPEGVHVCTMDEVGRVFGCFWKTDRRIKLTAHLRAFVEEARKSGGVAAVIVDGSYVTRKDVPNDIDVIVALRPDRAKEADPHPFVEKVGHKPWLRQYYPFDCAVVEDGDVDYHTRVADYTRVRPDDPEQATAQPRKGVLRIEL